MKFDHMTVETLGRSPGAFVPLIYLFKRLDFGYLSIKSLQWLLLGKEQSSKMMKILK